MVHSQVKKFLDKIHVRSPIVDPVQYAKECYLSFPYFGVQSEKLRDELLALLTKYFSDVKFKIVLVNNFRVGNLFHYKDVLPTAMRSSLVYSFCCAHCASIYVGSTVRILHSRVAEHRGRSSRTGARLTDPPHSLIRNHANTCSSAPIKIEDFKILGNCNNVLDLRILESLYIHKLKPVLNSDKTAVPLLILNT